MPHEETCWTLIKGAAGGDREARASFAGRYLSVVRAYLRARWRSPPLRDEVEDATQEVFVECFKDGGVLARAEDGRPGGFRGYFLAVVRNVARDIEERQRKLDVRKGASSAVDLDAIESDEERLSQVFDRAWIVALMRAAAERQAQQVVASDERARRRVELLRLRFHEELPIREIARSWGVPADELHHEYALARREFRQALLEVVQFHHPSSSPSECERECERMMASLG